MTADVPGHVWQAAVDAAVERIIGAPVADCDPAELIGIRQTVLDVLNTGIQLIGPHLAGNETSGEWEYGVRYPDDGTIVAHAQDTARRRAASRPRWQLVRRRIGPWKETT